MHGLAIELLDDLICAWSRWDEHEQYYLKELAPRIVRSEDPDFRWIDREPRARGRHGGPGEQVILVRMKELMSPEEWQILPELLRARRALNLNELESDSERRTRLAGREAARRDSEQVRRDAERERREAEEWPDALDRARSEGAERMRREAEQEQVRRQGAERERLERKADIARRLEQARRAQRDREEQARREAEEHVFRDEQRRAAREADAGSGADDHAAPSSAESGSGAEEQPDADPSGEGSHAPGGRRSRSSDGLIEGDAGGEHDDRMADDAGRPGGTPQEPGSGGAVPAEPPAAAEPPSAEETAMTEGPPDIVAESRLREWQNLANEGLITPEEHERLRSRHTRLTNEPPPGTPEELDTSGDGPAESPSGPEDAMTKDPPDAAGAPDPPGANGEASSGAPEPDGDAAGAASAASSPDTIGAAADLGDYAERLASVGERALADAVSGYAERVDGVARGELPPAMSVAPAAIAPEMVGAALARNRLEGWIEGVRNVLIFMPVLWTWLKLLSVVSAYTGSREQQFFDFWVDQGGEWPVIGGTLANAAGQVAFILFALVAVNVFLGSLRGRAERRREQVARDFAAVLARAETAGLAQRAADPQEALSGFVRAGTALTTELRTVGDSLRTSVAPLDESLQLVRQALTETSEAMRRQEGELASVVEPLRRIAQIGDQLGALEAAASRSADALGGIRERLEPSVGQLEQAAEALQRISGDVTAFGGEFAGAQASAERGAETLERISESLTPAAGNLDSAADALGRIGGEMASVSGEFAGAQASAQRGAEALEGIRDSLDPSAGRLEDASRQLAQMAKQVERMSEAVAGELNGLGPGLESSAGHLEEAAKSMNAVAARVLDELGGGRAGGR